MGSVRSLGLFYLRSAAGPRWKCEGGRAKCEKLVAFVPSTKETVGWTTDARNGFPLPFGRGEGQGEGIHEKMPTGRSFPLTPAPLPFS